jgi:hypothetical protein
MTTWLDIDQAATMVGLSRRHFRRKYVQGENPQGLRVPCHMFPVGSGRGNNKRIRFLRTDVERLKESIAA